MVAALFYKCEESWCKMQEKWRMGVVKIVQYMGITIICLCLLILGGVYVQQTYFPFDKSVKTVGGEKKQSSDDGQQKQKTEESNKKLGLRDYEAMIRHESYIYALTEEKAAEAREAGKTMDFTDFFEIPARSSTIDDGVIHKVVINTPFYTVAAYSNLNNGNPKENLNIYDGTDPIE
ncbi:hypothetical protein [Aneurinibacillus aneurinilyticus]|uniref:hypothetical protein n=1 Tax=Aneurinibacillus aneurinilyticus TaxID=1391 RepID=UPI003524C8A5